MWFLRAELFDTGPLLTALQSLLDRHWPDGMFRSLLILRFCWLTLHLLSIHWRFYLALYIFSQSWKVLLNLTHVVADVVIEWYPEEKHVLNPLLGHSPKGTTVHHKLLSLVYSLKTTPRLAAVFISFATKAKWQRCSLNRSRMSAVTSAQRQHWSVRPAPDWDCANSSQVISVQHWDGLSSSIKVSQNN